MAEPQGVDCRERVAFELAIFIAGLPSEAGETKDRTYYLTLYKQCHHATLANWSMSDVMRVERPKAASSHG